MTLDGSRSWGKKLSHEWIFTDGTKAKGATVERSYEKSGSYAEILKITDARGRTDYDFHVVQVIDKDHPDPRPTA